MNKRVIGLVRVSTEEQAEQGRAGVERQRTDIRAAAKMHGLDIERTVELIGVSGADVLTNSAFLKMLRDLERADIGGVVTSAVDRLTRPDTLGALGVFDPFQRLGKLIYTPGQIIDMRSDSGFLMSGLLGMLGGLERRNIRARCMAGKLESKKRGACPNGALTLPKGVSFDRTTGRWAIDPEWAAKIKGAYEMLFRRCSYREIAAKLGGNHAPTTVGNMLRNPIWCGLRRYQWERKEKKSVKVAVPLDIAIDIEPVISKQVWQRAQDILEGKRANWRKTKGPPRFLVSTLVRCTCGKAIYLRCAGRPTSKDLYYCSSRFPRGKGCGTGSVRREEVDSTVKRIITEHLSDLPAVRNILEQIALQNDASKPEATRATEHTVKTLAARRARLTDLAVDGLIGKDEFAKRARELDLKIREAEAVTQRGQTPTLDSKRLAAAIVRAFARFGKLPFEEQRELLRHAVTEIVLENAAIPSITFRGGFLDEIMVLNPFPNSPDNILNSHYSAPKANSSARFSAWSQISALPDLKISFPVPFKIAA